MEKILILIIGILMLLLLKILKQDLFSPAIINIIWNFMHIFFAVFIFDSGVAWNYEGVFWILSACFMFLVGQVAGNRICCGKTEEVYEKKADKISDLAYILVLALTIIAVFSPVIYVYKYGFEIGDIFNFKKLLEMNTIIASDRYQTHQLSMGAISSLLLVVVYMIPLCGGFIWNYARKKIGKFIAILTVFPMLLQVMITNAKAGIIAVVFLWAIGFILSYLKVNHKSATLKFEIVSKVLIAGGIMVAFLDFIMLMRIGTINLETQKIINKKMQIYALGHIQSFSAWFSLGDKSSFDLGTNTFMFFTNWLELTEREQGVYKFLDGAVSNVFTLNRGIIMDYGVLGGLGFWLALGFLAGYLYKCVKQKRTKQTVAVAMLGGIYFFIIYGFIISPWVYSSYVLAFLGFWFFLCFVKHVNKL